MGILSREVLFAHNDWTLAKGWIKVDGELEGCSQKS